MEQEKMGQFVQQLRKEKQLTQKELATVLGVSDKTISKWEKGNGTPDLPSMVHLCQFFGISMNELLACEKLHPNEYSAKAEENIMVLLEKNDKNEKSSRLRLFLGIPLLLLAFLFVGLGNAGLSVFGQLGWYVNGTALFSIAVCLAGCFILSGAKGKKGFLAMIESLILPITALITLINEVNALYSNGSGEIYFPLAVGMLPLLYGLVGYIVVKLMKK